MVHNIERKGREGVIPSHAAASRFGLFQKYNGNRYAFGGGYWARAKKAEGEGLKEEATPPLIGGGVESVVDYPLLKGI